MCGILIELSGGGCNVDSPIVAWVVEGLATTLTRRTATPWIPSWRRIDAHEHVDCPGPPRKWRRREVPLTLPATLPQHQQPPDEADALGEGGCSDVGQHTGPAWRGRCDRLWIGCRRHHRHRRCLRCGGRRRHWRHATIDNKYIKYGMLDHISLCGCPIPTPPVLSVAVALSVLHSS